VDAVIFVCKGVCFKAFSIVNGSDGEERSSPLCGAPASGYSAAIGDGLWALWLNTVPKTDGFKDLHTARIAP